MKNPLWQQVFIMLKKGRAVEIILDGNKQMSSFSCIIFNEVYMKFLSCFSFFILSVALIYAEFIPVKKSFQFNAYSLEQDSFISASYLNKAITEKNRINLSEDGHLYADGKRVRIFGTNLSEFPAKKDAEFSAKNLAAQGYNCIRFHHTDADWTNCFLKKDSSGKWIINKEKLDDFDYFFAELKKAGIYSNINLLTGRSISAADGFPAEIEKTDSMKGPHSLVFWYEPARDYQKKYAEELLSHVNPYTGLSYLEDPALAIVEINNENGFLMAFISGWIDDYKGTVFWKDLENQWNKWLKEKNLNYESLSAMYDKSDAITETLIKADRKGTLEKHQGAEAKASFSNNTHTIKILKNGLENWHVQYHIAGLSMEEGKTYTLKFSAKANKNCSIRVAASQAHSPWENAGFNAELNLTKKYQDYEFIITPQVTDENLRIVFTSLGLLEGTSISIKDLYLFKGGDITVVQKGISEKNVGFPAGEEYASLPTDYKKLITDFIWQKELDYWTSMKDYLKENLSCKALLMGTVVGCSTPYIQNIFDIIDTHAYWNHPAFPGKDWDLSNYYVVNRTLTKAAEDSTLVQLAKYRVFGKPFSVSEYDHPYPNQYTAEAYPMLSSFASFQDWDCIFTFCSELPLPSELASLKIQGYFDQSNASKACAAPFAARIFRNFLVEPADTAAYLPLSKENEKENLFRNRNWSIGNPELYGMNQELAKVCRLGIALDGYIPEKGIDCRKCSAENVDTSHNQIYWNTDEGVFAVNNRNLSITVSAPGADISCIPEDFVNKGFIKPFISSGDFAVFTAIKENNHSIIFSCRWIGNKNENLREYGSKTNSNTLSMTRDEIKLTTLPFHQMSRSNVLNSEGSLANPDGLKLFTINEAGKKSKEISNKKKLSFSASDKTLWYLLE